MPPLQLFNFQLWTRLVLGPSVILCLGGLIRGHQARGVPVRILTVVFWLLTIVVVLGGAGTAAQQEAPADAWLQFRGTPAMTGASLAQVPANIELLWSFEAGEAIDSSAAIADGTVYVGTYLGSCWRSISRPVCSGGGIRRARRWALGNHHRRWVTA